MNIEDMSAIELYATVGGRAEVLPAGNELRKRYEDFLSAMPTHTDEEASRENVFGPNRDKVTSNVVARQMVYLEDMKTVLKEILDDMNKAQKLGDSVSFKPHHALGDPRPYHQAVGKFFDFISAAFAAIARIRPRRRR